MLNTLKTQAMKRLLTIGLMLASAFALTNCAEEITAPVQEDVTVDGNIENITPPEEEVEIPFEVFANPGEEAETKTVNWGNGTYWYKNQGTDDPTPSDKISVFHKPTSEDKYTLNNEFTIADVATGLFTGSLKKALGEKNDWYFIYPNITSYSSSATTFTIPSIQIGASAQTQNSEEGKGKEHIAGNISPMYGAENQLDKHQSPNITMNHLAAIAAIKVVNNTDGPISLNNAKLEAYITVKENNKDVQKTVPITGKYSVEFSKDSNGEIVTTYAAVKDNSNIVTCTLNNTVPVEAGESYTFYFAVSPFETTVNNLKVWINGSEKMPLSSDEVSFEAGKVTTLRLEVEALSYPTESDALTYQFTGKVYRGYDSETKNVVTLYNIINGEYVEIEQPTDHITINNTPNVPIYVLGDSQIATTSIIKIEGTGKDLVNVLPITFYASRWNDKPTAMRLKKVDAYWSSLLTTDWLSLGTFSDLDGILGIQLDDGIDLDDLKSLGFGTARMTFSGIICNSSFNDGNVVIIDEERTSKVFEKTPGGNVETYLQMAGENATIQGLIDIFNGNLTTTAAKKTGQDLYDFIEDRIYQKAGSFFGWLGMKAIGVTSVNGLLERMRDAQFYIEIETCPHPDTNTTNPIVLWGIDKSENNN